MDTKQRRAEHSNRTVQALALATLWLAPLPAAFFVGRSVYWHLIHNWHVTLGALGIAAAVLAGAMIELVGLLSAHVTLATFRWNHRRAVRRDKAAWERSPAWLAAGCFGVYCVSAFCLAVVLEARPSLAVWAPALFTVMAAAAYLSVGLYEQHRDRLRYYGLAWDWKTLPREQEEAVVQDDPDAGRVVPDAVQDVPDMAGAGSDLDRLDREILRTFRTAPDASYRTVAEAVGSAKTTVAGRTERLVRAGLLARTGEGMAVLWSDNGRRGDGNDS